MLTTNVSTEEESLFQQIKKLRSSGLIVPENISFGCSSPMEGCVMILLEFLKANPEKIANAVSLLPLAERRNCRTATHIVRSVIKRLSDDTYPIFPSGES
jgi:hypothetical protein